MDCEISQYADLIYNIAQVVTRNLAIGETKRHLSDRFGEHRRTIEKRHIDQSSAVSEKQIYSSMP